MNKQQIHIFSKSGFSYLRVTDRERASFAHHSVVINVPHGLFQQYEFAFLECAVNIFDENHVFSQLSMINFASIQRQHSARNQQFHKRGVCVDLINLMRMQQQPTEVYHIVRIFDSRQSNSTFTICKAILVQPVATHRLNVHNKQLKSLNLHHQLGMREPNRIDIAKIFSLQCWSEISFIILFSLKGSQLPGK